MDMRPGDDHRLLTITERVEAGREVYRLLARAGGWVDEVFIGWPNLSPRYIQAGVEEVESRGYIERRPGGKGRHQVRLRDIPAPRQLSLYER
jgi:hypothetical protein